MSYIIHLAEMSNFCVYVFRAVVSGDVLGNSEFSDPMVKERTKDVNGGGVNDGVDNDVMRKGIDDYYEVIVSI